MKKLPFYAHLDRFKQHLLVFFLYAFLALAFLSPTGSGNTIPAQQDAKTHIAAIIQAKAAMQEGQFPVRTAPMEYEGLGYPKFQFYAPTLYLATNLLYSYTAIDNPYVIFKTLLFCSFLLGGFFLFRLSLLFTQHFSASVLAGFAYMAAPYFLIDAHWRFALAEVISLGLIPITLYYSIQLCLKKSFSLKDWLFASIFWYCLITLHLITFVNTSLFGGLFILLLNANKNFFSLWRIATAYLWGCILAAWFLVPIYLDSDFFIITHHVSDMLMTTNWLTSLPRLLSITSLPLAFPHPGNLSAPFYPAVGWPLLIGFTICLIGIFTGKIKPYTTITLKLIGLFLLALFMAWSPVDFWQYLPKVLNISQFAYRLLAEVIWLGALLTGIAFSIILEKNFSEWLVIPLGIWLIGLSSSSWFMSPLNNTISTEAIQQHPYLSYHFQYETNYLIRPDASLNHKPITPNVSVSEIKPFCQRKQATTYCNLPASFQGGTAQFPILYYPSHLIKISIDGKEAPSFATQFNGKFLLIGLTLTPGQHSIAFTFTGIHWANQVSVFTILLSLLGLIILSIYSAFLRIRK